MQLNTLCDKAKEILMEESNVQVGQLTEKFSKFPYAKLNLFSDVEIELNTLCDKAKEILMEESNVQVGQLTEKFSKFPYAKLNLFSDVEIEACRGYEKQLLVFSITVSGCCSSWFKSHTKNWEDDQSSFYAFQVTHAFFATRLRLWQTK
ncbi:hypothetical protein CTI12_AA107880 [Artemisia annua]|uniref:Uncharacterized protein n=1 Tax=Artemisia annua TaxID=35608 RepID=A0A2U1PVH2_ARTAN|nr:hypothetical protein CTI12_AA107880 [Artemisia annua]